jgi:protein-disulfide isomerase
MIKDIVYGGVIIVLVALLTLSVLTQGFGFVPCAITDNVDTSENSSGNDVGNDPSIPQITVGPGDMPALGQTNALVTWIEFSDYQCIFCSKLAIQTNSEVKSNYVNSGKVKMYFRDFPLGFHDKAADAALASRCANDQGKFWAMHDKLFAEQSSWSASMDFSSVLSGYATELGMDASKFDACVAGKTYSSEIGLDMQEGSAAGISGTPGVFLVLPKDKTDLNAVKSVVSGSYKDYMDLFQDDDNYIVMVVGALPYSAFEPILKTVNY